MIIFAGILFIGIAANIQRFSHADYQNYRRAGQFLNERMNDSTLLMATSEFWFVLEKKDNLLDDYRLGYRTGKRADFIVIDTPRYRGWQANLAAAEPAAHQYVENSLQNDYDLIYEDKFYRIYQRKSAQ